MPSHQDDDIDDIMSSILQGRPSNTPLLPKQPKQKPQPKPIQPRRSILDTPSPAYSVPKKAPKSPRKPFKLKKSVKVSIIIVTAILALGAVGFVLRKPVGSFVSDLLAPPSPFSAEVTEKAGFPLYYPTKLPAGYKIETDSVRQPEEGVVIYAITTDDGKRFNINLQKKPAGLNLDPLYNALTEIKETDTKFGKVKTGTSGEGMQITNILTDQSWIIINSSKDTLTQEDLVKLVNSLRES